MFHDGIQRRLLQLGLFVNSAIDKSDGELQLDRKKSPRYPLNRMLDGPQDESVSFGKQTKFLPLLVIETRLIGCQSVYKMYVCCTCSQVHSSTAHTAVVCHSSLPLWMKYAA